MSDFDTTSRLVLARARRLRRAPGDSRDLDLGPSLNYLAASADWDGEGWTQAEIGPAANWARMVQAPMLEDAAYWRGVWDQARWRLLSMPVAAKVLDIAAHTGGPYTAQVVMNRALRACGRDIDDATQLDDGVLAAIRNLYMRDQEPALLAALRAEHAALYRIAAAGLDGLQVHLSGWLRHAYL